MTKYAVDMCPYIMVSGEVQEAEGVHSGSKKNLDLQGPAAYRIGANKMRPNFDSLKGSLGDVFRSCSALKI
jgi:hypothetical protein